MAYDIIYNDACTHVDSKATLANSLCRNQVHVYANICLQKKDKDINGNLLRRLIYIYFILYIFHNAYTWHINV